MLEDVDRADARVVRAATLSRRTDALTAAHRDALVRAAGAVRADLADLREQVRGAEQATRLLALRRAVPSHAGGHLAAVVRLVGKADRAVAASSAADALLTAALDAAGAEGKDVVRRAGGRGRAARGRVRRPAQGRGRRRRRARRRPVARREAAAPPPSGRSAAR